MPRKKNFVFVVVLFLDGKRFYFVNESSRIIKKKRGRVLNCSEGTFSSDLINAKKYLNKVDALWVASWFEGATVESINEGEVLK